MNPFHLPSDINNQNNEFCIKTVLNDIDNGIECMQDIIDKIGSSQDTIKSRQNFLSLKYLLNEKIIVVKREICEFLMDDENDGQYDKILSQKTDSLQLTVKQAIKKFGKYPPCVTTVSTESSPLLLGSGMNGQNDYKSDVPLTHLSLQQISGSNSYTFIDTDDEDLINDLDEMIRKQELFVNDHIIRINISSQEQEQGSMENGQYNVETKWSQRIILTLIVVAIISLIAAVWTYFW